MFRRNGAQCVFKFELVLIGFGERQRLDSCRAAAGCRLIDNRLVSFQL